MRKFGFSKLFFLILFSISALAISCTDNASDDDSKGSSTGGGTGGGTGTGTGGGTGTATTTGGTPAKGQVKYEIKQCGQNLESIGSGAEACASQKGSNGYTLITAKYIVAEVGYGNKGPERKYKKEILAYGGVLIDDKGKISCVGCHCLKAAESAAANKIVCPNSVVSPGLINAHEHLYFSEFGPPRQSSERYDHRHEWRKGSNGKSRIKVSANKSSRGELIGELRHMMAGATSVIGSGGRAGLLRNLDVKSQSGIPNIGKVEYETFPLGDTDGKTLNSGCDYKFTFQKDDMKSFQAFIPHISEGINYAAHNEFRCLSSDARGLISSKTAIIHGIGLSANDISLLAKRGAGLIWSPRSNISLYGQTADVLSYHRMDVPIALGTDWVASGSMNMLREISCALNLNGRHYNGFFTLDTIFEMATINGAKMAKLHEQIGSIKEDKFADIAIYKSIKDKEILLSILTAQVQDVQLVMRGGKILYGNKLDLAPLKLNRCEDLDVCSIKKTVCLEDDTAVKSGAGYKIADIYLNKENKKVDAYPLFFCKEITAEPSCNPSRPNEYNKSEPNDRDGDGMVNNEDNCPDHFNPKRPMDKDLQPDFDGDKKGDTCDICPVDPGAEANECKGYDPNDSDGDSVKNEKDNCPNIQNKDQLDTDDDGQGDVCDLCPKVKNAKGQPCPRTVVEIKTGKVKMGSNVFIPNLIITTVMPKFRCSDPANTATCDVGIWAEESHSGDVAKDAKNKGIFIYIHNSIAGKFFVPAVGDNVKVSGRAKDFFGQIQIDFISQFEKSGESKPVPPIVIVKSNDIGDQNKTLSKALEGMRVRIENVKVSHINLPAGKGDSDPSHEFMVDSNVKVNDLLNKYPMPKVGDTFKSISGVYRWANESFKIEPDSNGLVQ